MTTTVTETFQRGNANRYGGAVAVVTLKTIADRLHVSVTSVSNAFNRPDQLSPELRDRILATADELGYAGPDPRAMALRGNRVGAIALVGKALPAAFTDPASLLMLGGIAEACDEAGVALVLIPFSDHGGGRDDILRSVVVDGVVAHCDALDPARRGIIADRGLPLVVLDGRPVGDEPSVVIDDEGGARAAARHLLELGHVRLAVVRFAPLAAGLANLVEEQRMAGYRAAVAEAGLDPDDLVVVEGAAYDRAATAAAVGELLDRPDRPTAVLAMSDEMGVATIEAARQRELRVPEDLSVVGFDDTGAAATSRPPLTTVHQPHAAKAAAAVRILLAGARREDSLRLPVELVVRESSAPPPA